MSLNLKQIKLQNKSCIRVPSVLCWSQQTHPYYMLLEPQVASERLESPRNLATRFSGKNQSPYYQPSNVVIIDTKRPGGDPINVPAVDATLIATLGRSKQATQVELAKEFGITQQGVSRIVNKGTSAVDEAAVTSVLDKVEDLALERLMSSLGLITDDKMSKSSAKDLSTIAGNLSKVHSNLKGQGGTNGPVVNIQIFKPEKRAEHLFQTIDV